MNNIPHINPHILVRRVVNEECVLYVGSSALETIWMVKKSIQGLHKEVWPLRDGNSVRVANYIAPILFEGATSLELLRQTWSASTHKRLEHRFEVLLIAAQPKGVGVRNNNKRKESTRVREVCSNCQFFFG